MHLAGIRSSPWILLLILLAIRYDSCADPGIFVRWGGGGGSRSIWHIKKALKTFFFLLLFFFFSPQLILQKSSGYFQKKTIICQGSSGVGIFSKGGVQLFAARSNCFFPIETHITCDFPGGQTPSGSAYVIPRIVVLSTRFSLFFFNITFANAFVEREGT